MSILARSSRKPAAILILMSMLLLLVCPAPTQAAGMPNVLVSNGSGQPGNTVDLTFTLESRIGVAGVQYVINYDEEVFSVDDQVADPDLNPFPNGVTFNDTGFKFDVNQVTVKDNIGQVSIAQARTGGTGFTTDGTCLMVTIHFQVLSGALNGSHPITISNALWSDGFGDNVLTSTPGTITVSGGVDPDITPPAFVAGYPAQGTEEADGSKLVNIDLEADEDAYLYGVITDSNTQPTKIQIEQDQDHTGAHALDSAGFDLTANSTFTWADISLPADDTIYYAHMYLVDDADNESGITTLEITTPPAIPFSITDADVLYGNQVVDITFNEGVYGDSGHSTPVDATDFAISVNSNGGAVTEVIFSSARTTGNGDLVGGETTVRLFITDETYHTLVASGVETITITPKDNSSIFNSSGAAMLTTSTTGPLTLTDTKPPVLSETTVSDYAGTSANLNFRSDEAGTYYYLVYNATDSAPNAATIKAQGTAVAQGTGSAQAALNSAAVSGFSAATKYKAYLVVEDAEGNISQVSTLSIVPPPTITDAVMDPENDSITVTFSEPVYGDAAHSSGITKYDLNLTTATNGGVVSGASIRNLLTTGLTMPVGGETVFVVQLSLVDGPPTGAETIAVNPEIDSVFNLDGVAAAETTTTGPLNLNLLPAMSFVTGYPKAGAVQPDGSKTVQFLAKVDSDGVLHHVVLPDGATAPTAQQVKDHADIDGNPVLTWGGQMIGADFETSITTSTNLTHDTDYDVYLVAEAGNNNFTTVGKVDVKTPPAIIVAPPGPIQSFACLDTDDYTATFNWHQATGATNLKIQYSLDNAQTWSDATHAVINTLATNATVTGLSPSTAYAFRLVVTGGDNVGNSNEVWASTSPWGTISGTVTDDFTDNPIAEASISLFASSGGDQNYIGGATTAADGSYTIENVPVGTGRYIFVAKQQYLVEHDMNVVVTEDSTTTINFVMEKILAGGYPKAGTTQPNGSKQLHFLVKANGDATNAYYVVLPDGATQPSELQIQNGHNSTGSAAIYTGGGALAEDVEQGFGTGALPADNTAYDVFVVLQRGAYWSEIQKLDMTTPPAASSAKAIVDVWKIEDSSSGSAVLLHDYNIQMNSTTHVVTVTLSYGSVLTNLAPYFTVSDGANMDPASGTEHDFSDSEATPLIYTVTAEDGSSQQWSVTIQAGESQVTSIQVKTGSESIVKYIDNSSGQEKVIAVKGTKLNDFLDALEATDGSPQSYSVTRSNGSVLDEDDNIYAGYILKVQADDPDIVAYYDIYEALYINGVTFGRVRGVPTELNFASSSISGGAMGTKTWQLTPGSENPPGLTLHPDTGIMDGTPTTAGDYTFDVSIFDAGALTVDLSSATATFTLEVVEPAWLNTLTISEGTLTPAFNTEIYDYTATVANTVTSVIIDATADASFTIDPADLGTKDLAVGANTFNIVVQGDADHADTTYTVTITRNSPSGGGGGGGAALPGMPIRTYGSVLEKDGAVINVPAGAVSEDTRGDIVLRDSSKIAPPAECKIVGSIFEFTKKAEGDFLKPVEVTLPFNRSLTDLTKYTVSIYWFDENNDKWEELDNAKVDALIVSGETTKTGYFALIATPKAAPPAQPVLTDIKGHWAETAILSLVQMGAIDGYPDKTFKPQQTITRAEFATVLVKAYKLDAAQGKVFDDTANHWAKDYIAAAYAAGIIEGYDAKRFGPDDLITREQMAVMIVKASKLQQASGQLSFKDSGKVSVWAYSWVMSAVNNQLMQGYSDNTFRPQNNATRAEAVTVIYNALN